MFSLSFIFYLSLIEKQSIAKFEQSNNLKVKRSPSLLFHEKPKQSRKTRTREIYINATDALADLVRTAVSSTKGN